MLYYSAYKNKLHPNSLKNLIIATDSNELTAGKSGADLGGALGA